MAQVAKNVSGSNTVELATFYIRDALCGMDILKVRTEGRP